LRRNPLDLVDLCLVLCAVIVGVIYAQL